MVTGPSAPDTVSVSSFVVARMCVTPASAGQPASRPADQQTRNAASWHFKRVLGMICGSDPSCRRLLLEHGLCLRQRLVQLARVLAAAARAVGLSPAFPTNDGGDGLNNLSRLNLRGELW